MESKQNQKVSRLMAQLGHWRQDFLASLVVFLVALPLCMGIAIASGAPASTGLIGGVIGGLIVGAIGGCPLQVSGPAAGLATVMFEAIQRHGLEQLGLMVFMAGLLQLGGALLGIGQWFRAVSPAVIQGMLAGIGVLIFSSQFHVMLDDVPKGSGLQDLMTIPQAIQKAAHLPEPIGRDSRHLQREILQELGELHRRQVNLNEQIAELVPHNRRPPSEESHRQLEAFVPEQEEIKTQLQALIARTLDLFPESSSKREKILEYGDRALAAQDVFLKDLREEQWAYLLDAQEDAAKSLAEMQVVFKNHELAAGVGVLAILVLVLWKTIARGGFKVIPAPLVAVVVGTLAAAIWQLPVLYVEVPQSMIEELHLLHWSVFQNAEWSGIMVTAATIAILATAQTLLTATAVDHMHHGERTDYDKELFAQGIGNCVCGFVGALPLAAVIVRSTANLEAGGKTRWSTMMHGLWILIIVAFFGVWLRMVPTAVLAAILVYTGYKLADWRHIPEFLRFGYGELAVYLITLGTVVCVDLLVGVVTGFFCSLALLAYRFSRLRTRVDLPDEQGKYVVHLEGAATFLKLPKLARTLAQVPAGSEVQLEVHRLHYLDQACLENLRSWANQHHANGGTVIADWELMDAWVHQGMRSPQAVTVEPIRPKLARKKPARVH